jgi:hypothetical protein
MPGLNRHGGMQNTPETIIGFANKISSRLRGRPTVTKTVTITDLSANDNAIKSAWLSGELDNPANDQEEAAIAEFLAS